MKGIIDLTELPKKFLEDIEEILKDEYDDFIKSYEESKTTGLRINTLKLTRKDYLIWSCLI